MKSSGAFRAPTPIPVSSLVSNDAGQLRTRRVRRRTRLPTAAVGRPIPDDGRPGLPARPIPPGLGALSGAVCPTSDRATASGRSPCRSRDEGKQGEASKGADRAGNESRLLCGSCESVLARVLGALAAEGLPNVVRSERNPVLGGIVQAYADSPRVGTHDDP